MTKLRPKHFLFLNLCSPCIHKTVQKVFFCEQFFGSTNSGHLKCETGTAKHIGGNLVLQDVDGTVICVP